MLDYRTRQPRSWLDKIDDHFMELGVPKNTIPASLMEKSFTHSSYLNLREGKGCISNSCLSIMGAVILQVYCTMYLLDNLDDFNRISHDKTTCLLSENLAKTIPISWVYDMKSYGLRPEDGTRESDSLEIDIIESVCARNMDNMHSKG